VAANTDRSGTRPTSSQQSIGEPPERAPTNETLQLGNGPWRVGTDLLQGTCAPWDPFDPYRIVPDFIPSANSSLPKGIFAAIARLILADQQDHAANQATARPTDRG